MPESERDIEKRLKAYAKKRRQEAGAPLELHPATRRVLQGEVSRRKAKATGDTNWLARLFTVDRSRFAVITSVVAVLVVAAVALVSLNQPAKSKSQLARLEEKDASVKTKNELAVNQPASASRVESDAVDRQRRDQSALFDSARHSDAVTVATPEIPSRSFNETRKALAEPEPAALPTVSSDKTIGGIQSKVAALPVAAPAEEAPATTRFALGAVTNTARVTLASSPPTGTAGSSLSIDSLGASDGKDLSKAIATETPQPAVLAQNFTQITKQKTPALNAAGGGPQSVLNNFRVEQSGEAFQIIDSDGSTYIGYVQPAKEQELLAKKLGAAPVKGDSATEIAAAKPALKESLDQELARRNRAPDQTTAAPAMQNYFFRVTGTNRALNQSVVFTGNWIADPGVAATAGFKASVQDAQQLKFGVDAKQFQNLQSQFQNSRINGTAVVGENQKLDIDAIAVPTP